MKTQSILRYLGYCLGYFLGLSFCALLGCGPLERNSPFSENTITAMSRTNDKTILQLNRHKNTPGDIVFNLISDSHQNYDDLNIAIKGINQKGGDFTAHLGDFTNQGYNVEFDLFAFRINKLKMPFVIAIGNHETLVKGKYLFDTIFGSSDNFFDFKGYRFIIFNNNNLDFLSYGGLKWDWLEEMVNDSTLPVILFFHINPDNQEYFNSAELQRYQNIVANPLVKATFNGHRHVWAHTLESGLFVHQVSRTQGSKWSRVTIQAGTLNLEHCRKGICTHETSVTLR